MARAERLTAERWVEAALDAVVRGGVAAVAVEPLASELGVTKGSFYWHFSGRDALLQAAVERWEREDTDAVIQELTHERDPRRRIERLFHLVVGTRRSITLFLALTGAARNPIVAPVVRRVSARRIDYLSDCFRRLGLGRRAARHRALLAYSVYAGMSQLHRDAPAVVPRGAKFGDFLQTAIEALIPAGTRS